MRYVLASGLLIFSTASAPPATGLVFNGLNGSSTIQDVRRRFPTSVMKNECQRSGKTILQSVDVPYGCEIAELKSYKLFGYDFEAHFYFYPSGSLKGLSLRWPSYEIANEYTDSQIKNVHFSIIDHIVSKYGRYVSNPPCELVGNICAEWQMDGNTTWHAGGERIELASETRSRIMRGVTLSYKFADRASFGRF